MEAAKIVRLEGAARESGRERQLELVEGAVRLVASGVATRVRLASLDEAEAIGPTAAAIAQRYGVRFRVDRSPERESSIVIGPLEVA